MSPSTLRPSVTHAVLLVRVVNRLGGFGMGFLGLRAADVGLDMATVGTVLAAFGLATIPSRLLGGVLATRYGGRTAVVAGLVACALALGALALGSSVVTVVAAVLALGLAYEIIEPATQALVAEHAPDHGRAGAFALLWSTLAVAGVVAGVLAALVLPFGVRALYAVDAASSLLAAACAAVLLPGGRAVIHPAPWRAAATPRLLGWTAVGTAHAVLVMVVVFLLPLSVVARGEPASLTGWLLAVAAAAAIGAQRLVARGESTVGPRAFLVIGHVLLAAGCLAWALPSPLAWWPGAVLEGASGSLLLGTYQAGAARLAPPGAAAAAMTIFGLSWGLATVAAPLAGVALLAQGPTTLWLACAAGSAVMAVLPLAARGPYSVIAVGSARGAPGVG